MKANVGSQVMVKKLFCEPGIRTKKVKTSARLVGLTTLSLQPQNLPGMFGWVGLSQTFSTLHLMMLICTESPQQMALPIQWDTILLISNMKSALTFCLHLMINFYHTTKYYELVIILKYYELTFHEWLCFMLYWSESSLREKYNIILDVCVGLC